MQQVCLKLRPVWAHSGEVMLSNSLVEWLRVQTNSHGKIKKNTPRGLLFSRRSLFVEGLIFGGKFALKNGLG